MAKPFKGVIGYWGDQGDGRKPNGSLWKETVVGHEDEDLREMPIDDMRGEESSYRLDVNGFQPLTLAPRSDRDVKTLVGDDTEYFSEVESLIKKTTGAKHVHVFAKIIRQHKRDALTPDQFIPGQVQGPSPKAHVDFTPENAIHHVYEHIPELKDRVDEAPRWQVLGIWRPIKTVKRDPLVIADGRTVSDNDFLTITREQPAVGNAKIGAASVVKYGEEKRHQWYYWSDMTPEEVLLFKHFDSDKALPAWRVPHTSVAIPGTTDLPARESCEVRAIVTY